MINFLDETLEFIDNNRLSPKDILYIGSPHGCSTTWALFRLKSNYNYENYNEFPIVPTDLKIIFRNYCMLERKQHKENNSSDGKHLSTWSLTMSDKIPTRTKRLVNLFVIESTRSYTLSEINP